MMKKAYYILGLAGMLLSGCSDFLDKASSDEVIVKTIDDYSELLLGSGYPSPTEKLYTVLYLLDDDYMLNERSMNDDEDYASALSAYPFVTWQPDMWQDQHVDKSWYVDCYSATFTRIMGVNAVLDGVDDAIGSPSDREKVKAQALALRGYYYFMLVNLFATPYNVNPEASGVPVKLTANMETNGMARMSVKQVYAQIVSDMEEAAALMAKYPYTTGDFRLNEAAVNILLTRVYLQMEDWDKVIASASKAIEKGGVLTNYNVLPSSAAKRTFSTYGYSEVVWLYGNGYSTCSMPGIRVSTDLLAQYEPNDMRLKMWFDPSYGNVYKKRLGTQRTPTNALRISEAYLSRAEAYARKGSSEQAWTDLEHLRENRISNYQHVTAPSDADVLLNDIRLERRLELCFDEVRWFDLRRYGMPQIEHLYKNRRSADWQKFVLKKGDPLYVLPIPNEVIKENNSLQQNESATAPKREASN